MHNNGAYDANNVVVFFEVNPQNAAIFTDKGSEYKNQIRYEMGFKGRSEEFPLGDVRALKIFQIQAKELGDYYGNQRDVTFSADICYDYLTIATPNVCVGRKSKNPLDCNLDENNEIRFDYPEGQGSPIVISTVVQKIRNYSGNIIPYFLIEIDNFGDGETFVNNEKVGESINMTGLLKENYVGASSLSGEEAGSCRSSDLRYDDGVLINLQLSEYDDSKFICKNLAKSWDGKKMFKLKEGHATISCDLCIDKVGDECKGIGSKQTSFYSPLIIKLFYNYKLTLAESASIVSADFEEDG